MKKYWKKIMIGVDLFLFVVASFYVFSQCNNIHAWYILGLIFLGWMYIAKYIYNYEFDKKAL